MPHVVISVTHGQRLRALAIWLTVTLGAAGVGRLTVPVVVEHDVASFTDVLVWCCSAVALVSAGAAWWITTDVARSVVAGRVTDTIGRARPGPVRVAVLLACGLSLVGSPALAAVGSPHDAGPARDPSSDRGPAETASAARALDLPLAGLPLPDRASDARAVATQRSHIVRRGDHLWGIARAELGPDASDVTIAARVDELHRANAAVIGDDPDLILPGQHLRLPPVPGRNHR